MKASRLLSGLLSVSFTLNMFSGSALIAGASVYDAEDMRDCLKAGFSSYAEEIDISKYNISYSEEDIKALSELAYSLFEDPDMFCISYDGFGLKGSPDGNGGYILTKIYNINYLTDPNATEVYKAEFNEMSQKIIDSLITPEMTDLEKALRLHDYLALNAAYDLDDSMPDLNKGYSAYDIIVKQNGVCQGYALAYQHLLSLVGIESKVVKSLEMNHGWNLVKIDGNWYHVDVTWDDPVPDTPGRVNHNYFMLSDEAISQKSSSRYKEHYGWDNYGITAESTLYDNMFWNTVSSEIFVMDDKWYFVDGEGQYTTYYANENRTEVYVSLFENPWFVWGKQDTTHESWAGIYTSLIVSGDTMYFNTPTSLFSMKLDGSQKKGIKYINPYEYDGYCYGLVYQNDELYGVIKQKPDDAGKLVKLIDIHFDSYSYIESMLSKISELNEGENASFNLSAERFLPAQAIELIRDKNIGLNLECDDSVWAINGQNVKDIQTSDIDLTVNTNKGIIPASEFDGQAYIEINLSEKNDLRFTADLSYNMGKKFAGRQAVIYSYDVSSSKMIKVDSALIDSKGNVNVPVDSLANYAVVIEDTDVAGPIEVLTKNGISIVTGDTDGDTVVDITDLSFLSMYLLGDKDLSADQIRRADVSGDGETDLADLALMRQYIMHKITAFPKH